MLKGLADSDIPLFTTETRGHGEYFGIPMEFLLKRGGKRVQKLNRDEGMA